MFDATANDIRLGKVAATESGVTTGTKDIPAYHTTEGVEKIPAGSALTIPMFSDKCQYTKLQALICTFNTLVSDSVATEKVSIDGKVYNVGSTTVLSWEQAAAQHPTMEPTPEERIAVLEDELAATKILLGLED